MTIGEQPPYDGAYPQWPENTSPYQEVPEVSIEKGYENSEEHDVEEQVDTSVIVAPDDRGAPGEVAEAVEAMPASINVAAAGVEDRPAEPHEEGRGAPAEPVTPAAQLSYEVDAFIDTLGLPDEDAPGREDAVDRFVNDADIAGVVSRHAAARDIEGVGQALAALDRLEAAADGKSWFLQSLDSDSREVRRSLQALYGQNDPALLSVLDRAVNDEILAGNVGAQAELVQGVAGPVHGHMSEWRENGTVSTDLPPFIQRIAAEPEFPEACLSSEVQQIQNGRTDAREIAYKIEYAEMRLLVGVMGVGTELASDMMEALATRDLWSVEVEENSYSKKIVLDGWRTAMSRTMQHIQTLGPAKIQTIHEASDLVGIDVYSDEQMERMAHLVEGTPDVNLETEDITLVLSATYDDHTNDAAEQVTEYEDGSGRVYFGGFSRPIDIYRVPVTLARRFGLVACTIVVVSHGDVNEVDGAGELAIGAARGGYPVVAGPVPTYEGKVYDINESQVGRLAHKYMRPSHETGERAIVLSSCDGAAKGGPRNMSVAESVALSTDPEDKVVVSGSVGTATAQRLNLDDPDDRELIGYSSELAAGEGVLFWDVVDDAPLIVHAFRHKSPGVVRRSIHLTIPGVR